MECVHENSTVPDLFVWKWGELTGIVPTARAEAACKTMHLNGKVTFLFQKENSMTSLYFPNWAAGKRNVQNWDMDTSHSTIKIHNNTATFSFKQTYNPRKSIPSMAVLLACLRYPLHLQKLDKHTRINKSHIKITS